jgi:glutathione synthase/RimK-type ligase-like ATP-grasp enzyme
MDTTLIVTDVRKFDSLFSDHQQLVISPEEYLSEIEKKYSGKEYSVYNLAGAYRYQSLGYYISLLAEARGQKVYPSTAAILDIKSKRIVQSISEELDEELQRSLASIRSDTFVLSVYFGKNLAKKYAHISKKLFELFQTPLFRVTFKKEDRWEVEDIDILKAKDLSDEHWEMMLKSAQEFFSGKKPLARKIINPDFDIAILVDREEQNPPSNSEALEFFSKAFRKKRALVEFIDRDEYQRIPEFDGLFIRTTTGVNHYTYRFARYAQTEGLAVVDDPTSILRCANKVFLAELLAKRGIAAPQTQLLFKSTYKKLAEKLTYPQVLKQPDGSSSQGVVKAESASEFIASAQLFFKSSELLISQEYMRTDFDWRIGVLDNEVLYACKYYMVDQHWQIFDWSRAGDTWGNIEAIPLAQVPEAVITTALRATKQIGSGLYGVDIKETPLGVFVIEVNDNPSIDAGYEDTVLGAVIYEKIAEYFVEKIRALQAAQRVSI